MLKHLWLILCVCLSPLRAAEEIELTSPTPSANDLVENSFKELDLECFPPHEPYDDVIYTVPDGVRERFGRAGEIRRITPEIAESIVNMYPSSLEYIMEIIHTDLKNILRLANLLWAPDACAQKLSKLFWNRMTLAILWYAAAVNDAIPEERSYFETRFNKFKQFEETYKPLGHSPFIAATHRNQETGECEYDNPQFEQFQSATKELVRSLVEEEQPN